MAISRRFSVALVLTLLVALAAIGRSAEDNGVDQAAGELARILHRDCKPVQRALALPRAC